MLFNTLLDTNTDQVHILNTLQDLLVIQRNNCVESQVE